MAGGSRAGLKMIVEPQKFKAFTLFDIYQSYYCDVLAPTQSLKQKKKLKGKKGLRNIDHSQHTVLGGANHKISVIIQDLQLKLSGAQC